MSRSRGGESISKGRELAPGPARRARSGAAPVCVALSLLGFWPAARGAEPPVATASAAPIGPVTAADVLAEVRASRGSVVLVNVWATWCVPCREEFPDLLRLQRELGGKGLRLVLVSADLASQRPQVETFLRREKVEFRTFVKAQADQEFIDGLDRRWSGSLPASLLFDRRGKEVGFWEGGSSYSELVAKVEPLLNAS